MIMPMFPMIMGSFGILYEASVDYAMYSTITLEYFPVKYKSELLNCRYITFT